MLEPAALFELLFGSDNWLDWIGTLQAVMLAELVTGDAASKYPAEAITGLLQFKQLAREVQCAVHLATLTDQLNDQSGGTWKQCWELVQKTVVTPMQETNTVMGSALMGLIGRVYTVEATQRIGNQAASMLAGVQEIADSYSSHCTAVGAAMKTAYRGLGVAEAVSTADGNEEAVSVTVARAAMVGALVEAAYAVVVVELEWTVRCAVWNVLHDRSQTDSALLRRAEVMAVIGKAFEMSACSKEDAIAELKSQIGGLSASNGTNSDPEV